jgi:hypothetical protein
MLFQKQKARDLVLNFVWSEKLSRYIQGHTLLLHVFSAVTPPFIDGIAVFQANIRACYVSTCELPHPV